MRGKDMAKKNTRRSARRGAARDRQSRKALAIGRRMARDVIAFRDKALRRRALVLRRSRVVSPAAVPIVPPARVRAAGGPLRSGVLVAEGDSWFDYPWHDGLRMLEDRHGFDVESVAHKGDSVEQMAYGGGQLEEFTRLLEKLIRQSIIPSAVLLSGGGNDVAGPEFGMLLNHVSSARAGLNEQ